ncbi:hypothetical protein D7193_10960 [Micromonospora costi]|uniref:Uncharacterized protein n=1 Tax=Micromonospora costi TaxID=1530042 RepID=A0A3B0A474_9ACTN|nr:hypothetical protein D7193_10960 [Micromonospora costi]
MGFRSASHPGQLQRHRAPVAASHPLIGYFAIAEALTRDGIPSPSAADPARNPPPGSPVRVRT